MTDRTELPTARISNLGRVEVCDDAQTQGMYVAIDTHGRDVGHRLGSMVSPASWLNRGQRAAVTRLLLRADT